MRLLLYGDNGLVVRKQHIASFVLFDRQALPAVIGVEYLLPSGVVRTFSDSSASDFHEVLHRSGALSSSSSSSPAARNSPSGVPSVLCTPFLGKGVPEWFDGVAKLLVINDSGKYLFAARRDEWGKFEAATYGDQRFDDFIRAFF